MGKSYLELVMDAYENDAPKNGSLAEHRKLCEAKPGNCPFEKRLDDADSLGSERPKRQGGEITPEQDAAYADAVKRGDTETAQRMVREAAALAMPDTKVVDEDGLPLVVWHGSVCFDPINGNDHVFDNQQYDGPSQIGARKGFFFTPNYKIASRFGKKGTLKYVPNWSQLLDGSPFKSDEEFKEFGNRLFRITSPQTDKSFFDKRDAYFDIERNIRKGKERIAEENQPIVTSAFINMNNPQERSGFMIGTGLERESFLDSSSKIGDGAIIYNADTGCGISDEYIAFTPNQIKSADITYGDDKRLIPLSKRFDFSNPDIRY